MQKLIAATPHLDMCGWTLIAVTAIVDERLYHGIASFEQDGRNILVSDELGEVGFDPGMCWNDPKEREILETALTAAYKMPIPKEFSDE